MKNRISKKASEAVTSIAESKGFVTAEMVVDAARDERSPLHGLFVWDDTEAARLYRLGRARWVIQNVTVTIESRGKMIETRSLVSLSTDRCAGGGVFRPTVVVMRKEDTRRLMLEDARSEMQAFIDKYSRLRELARVVSAMRVSLKMLRRPSRERKTSVAATTSAATAAQRRGNA
jgi:hypothetical protein